MDGYKEQSGSAPPRARAEPRRGSGRMTPEPATTSKRAGATRRAGLVLLVQERVCEMVYDYIAVKQRLPRAARRCADWSARD
jgi:hypothetical protein